MADLKRVVSEKILEEIVGRRKDGSSSGGKLQWKVLIVDDLTVKIVSSSLTMAQLASEGVSNVQHIQKYRGPNTSADAIFYVVPNKKNIDEILYDIKKKNFRAFNIMFSESCPKPLLDSFMQKVSHPQLIKSCKEVYISFVPVEKQVYSMSMKSFLPPPPNNSNDDSNQELETFASNLMDEMAEKLATLCSSVGGDPFFCYQNGCHYTATFAQNVSNRLTSMKPSESGPSSNAKGNQLLNRYPVLILDRGFDLISCLIHDLYYQAIAYDILGDDKIEVDKQIYNHRDENGENVPHQLDNTDSIWEELKHKHLSDAFKGFANIVKSEKIKEDQKKSGEGKTDMKKLKKDVQELTKDRRRRREMKVHSDITENLSMRVEYRKIALLENAIGVCEVEEGLATKNFIGQLTGGAQLNKENFMKLLLDKDIDEVDKIRLLAIYILTENVNKEDTIATCIQQAQNIKQSDTELFTNLFNYKFSSEPDSGRKTLGVQLQHKTRRKGRSSQNIIGTKWVPVLKDLIEDAMEEHLDKKLFSYLNQSITSAQTSSRRGTARRIIVFILGGINPSEFRVASEIANDPRYNNAEIIVGGSKILTPSSFIKDLRNLHKQDYGVDSLEGDVEEDEPLMGNGLSHSTQDVNGGDENFVSACGRYLAQGGKLVSDTFGACSSNICAKSS